MTIHLPALPEPKFYPDYEAEVRELVEQHKELADEPLLMALYFRSNRKGAENDVFVLEVLDNYPVSAFEEEDFLEVLYGSTPHFVMGMGQMLHLILTNLEELSRNIKRKTRIAGEIQQALNKGSYKLIFVAEGHKNLLEQIRA
jgi:hypothetical protein